MTNSFQRAVPQGQTDRRAISYFDCVAKSAEWFLSANTAAKDAYLTTFRAVSDRWCALPVTDLPPFRSGIDRCGYPVELSVTHKNGAPIALRWLAQAGPTDEAHETPALFNRLISYLPPASGTEHWCDFVQDLIACGVNTDRSYFSWFGVEAPVEPSRLPASKLYLNPWAVVGLSCSDVIGLVAAQNSVRPEIAAALERITDAFDTARPLIIGVNFRPGGQEPETKLYFVAHVDNPEDVPRRVAKLDRNLQARFEELLPDGLAVRELHIALSLDQQQGARVFKVNLYLGDQTLARSTGPLQSVLDQLDDARVVPKIRSEKPVSMALVNFVGLDNNKLDTYYRPWR